MKKLFLLFSFLIAFTICFAPAYVSTPYATEINYAYWATALTGGDDGAIDSFDGTTLKDKDICITIVKDTNLAYFHVLNAASGLDESSPDIIKPDTNAGLKRWILVNTYGAGAETFLSLTDTPATFIGQGSKFIKVNVSESALEFVDYAYVNHASNHTDGTDDIQNATSLQKGLATATQISKLDGIEALADVTATHETSHADVLVDGDFASGGLMKTDGAGAYSVVADTLHAQGTDTALGAVSEKNPPVDADKALYRDSTSSDALVTSTWTQIKAFLKTYFDTLYNKYVHPNHTGDVTSVADGATTISNDAVTYAKMQNVSATDKVLGRSSAGAGDVEEITCTSAGRALLDDANNTAQRETLGLVIGTDVQAYSDYLKQIADTSPLNGDILIGKSIDGSWNQVAGVFDDATNHRLKHESGGLEADVSAYNGLVKISGGATSEVADTLHTQNTDTGTTSTTFQIDSDATGPKLKNSSGAIEIRNEGDTAWADLYAGNVGYNEGVLSDPTIGDAAGVNISITSADCLIRSDSTWNDGRLYRKTVAENTSLAVTDDSINYIYVDWNGGTPIYAATTNRALINNSDVIPVARIYMSSGDIEYKLMYQYIGKGATVRNFDRVMRIRGSGGIERESGFAISETGTRVVNIASGVAWFGLSRISLDAVVQGVATSELWYHSGGVWTTANITAYNNSQYDNGANLAALTPNRYAVNWIYRNVSTDEIDIVLGTGDYTQAQAEASTVPSLPTAVSNFYVLCGRIIVQNGDDTAYAIENISTNVFNQASVTSHADLSGLTTGDDHTQYILDADFTAADEVMVGTGAGTHSQVTLAASQFLGKKAAGSATNLTAAEARTILNVADGADVTGSNAPQAHKDSHDPEDGSDKLDTAAAAEISTVVAAGIGSSHSFARADHVHAINHGITDNHIVTMDDADATANDYTRLTANGLEGRSYSEVMGDLSGQASADFSMNTHQITSLSAPDAAGEAIRQTATVTEANLNQLTDGSDTVLHDHDGISENTAARHTQNTDTGTTQTSFQIDSGASIVKLSATTTYEAISKTIGSGGDYATFAAAIAALPDMQSHNITLTILAGTTLTETCIIANRHAAGDAGFTVKAEKYWPTSGDIPQATATGATSLTDDLGTNNLKTAAFANDYFNGCWIFIVDGTGTDNGFVPITDYDGSNGIVTVASWPGTQPDNTSRYLIVGALVDCEGSRNNGFKIQNNTVTTKLYGIGVYNADSHGIYVKNLIDLSIYYAGIYASDLSGVYMENTSGAFRYSGVVGNNTDSAAWVSGITLSGNNAYTTIWYSGISDNNTYGVYVLNGGMVYCYDNFGDNNGTWGTYAVNSGQARCAGTECSGSSGNHSHDAATGGLSY